MKICQRSVFLLLFVLLLISGCGKGVKKVQFTSEPSGASVFFNNDPIGVTPFQATIKDRPGDYSIYIFEAVLEDKIPDRRSYKEETYQDTVDTVVPDIVNFILPERIGGTTYIWSIPSGAEVKINGKKFGKTPIRVSVQEILAEEKEGTANIVADLKGYSKSVQKVTLDPDKDQGNIPFSIRFKMVPWSW